ncbi:MAG: 4Fe-4S dicluster domain-containing protein [Desulfovibrionaceae bacterium]|nr:4Fe-4S dicluster domain-containing protein [Desulfovibrionaceae bacterium]
MQTRIVNIRAAAKAALEEGLCRVVAGYAPGAIAMRARPVFIDKPEDAGKLTWSSFCVGNLAGLLTQAAKQASGRIGVVAQGCVSRNLVGLIGEGRLAREDLYVIGVPCLGMAERRKIEARYPGRAIIAVEESEEVFVVRGKRREERMLRRDALRDNCYTCVQRNPVIYDALVAEPVPDTGGGDIDKVAAPWEKHPPGERLAAFQAAYANCTRCHACRDVCPLCYCSTCFVDESTPQWAGKTGDFADVATYHLLRALHCAGRCTDCGACESACPQNIKVRRLTSKLEKDVRALYGCQAGMALGESPPLTVFRPDDPQDFIK